MCRVLQKQGTELKMNMIVRGLCTLYSSIRYALFGRDGNDAAAAAADDYFLTAASWSLHFG